MALIPRIFRRFVPQILHIVILPIFFFLFMLIYQPYDADQFIGKEWYGVHVTIISCILFLCLILTRLLTVLHIKKCLMLVFRRVKGKFSQSSIAPSSSLFSPKREQSNKSNKQSNMFSPKRNSLISQGLRIPSVNGGR